MDNLLVVLLIAAIIFLPIAYFVSRQARSTLPARPRSAKARRPTAWFRPAYITDYNWKWAARWAALIAVSYFIFQIYLLINYPPKNAPPDQWLVLLIAAWVQFFAFSLLLWVLALLARGVYRAFGGKKLLRPADEADSDPLSETRGWTKP